MEKVTPQYKMPKNENAMENLNPENLPTKTRKYHAAYTPPPLFFRPSASPVVRNPLYDGKAKFTVQDTPRGVNILLAFAVVALFGLKIWQDYKADLSDSPRLTSTTAAAKNTTIWEDNFSETGIFHIPSDVFFQKIERFLPTKTVAVDLVDSSFLTKNSDASVGKIVEKPLPSSPMLNKATGNNLVFAGSFDKKENALRAVERLKSVGVQQAEIVMKDKSAHLTVVSGFYDSEKSAQRAAQKLRKRGIAAYNAQEDLTDIFRQKKK